MSDPIRELFKKHNVPLDRDDLWAVQGKPVVRHQAVERLGAALGIQWQPPQIVRAERDEAVILATGGIGERQDWSIGEALIGQNYTVTGKQKAYVFAMAEKRARDRVILKLAGLQGVYSEEEADDFKSRDPEPSNAAPRGNGHVSPQSREVYVENSLERIAGFDAPASLLQWAKSEREKVWPQYGIEPMDPDGQRIVKVYKARMAELGSPVGA